MPADEERRPASPQSLKLIQLTGAVALVLVAGVFVWRPWHSRVKTISSVPPAVAAPAAPVSEPAAAPGIVSSAQAAPLLAATSPTSAAAGRTDTAVGVSSAGSAGRAGANNAATNKAAASNAAAGSAGSTNASDPDAAPVPGAGRARLRLSFSADSWVDVHDAAGKRTFAGNGLANSVKTLSGLAPMRVYLGFGSGVQLEINDRAVAIGPQFFAGDVARFEAGADGVLRRDSRPDQTHGASSRTARPPG
jgi:cytoskeletal protein RodZ